MSPSEWVAGLTELQGQLDAYDQDVDFMETIDKKICSLLFESTASRVRRLIDLGNDYVDQEQSPSPQATSPQQPGISPPIAAGPTSSSQPQKPEGGEQKPPQPAPTSGPPQRTRVVPRR